MAIIASSLSRIKSDPLACLGGSDRVNAIFASAGHVWRKCVFDPATTLKLFILQVLHGNTAMSHLRHLSGMEQDGSILGDHRRTQQWDRLAGLKRVDDFLGSRGLGDKPCEQHIGVLHEAERVSWHAYLFFRRAPEW